MAVALVSSAVKCFLAQVSSQVHGLLPFNALGADFVVVTVCWEDYTYPAPAVIYRGKVGKVVTAPQLNVGAPGCLAIYAFEIEAPDSLVYTIDVSPTPNYSGWTSIFAAAYTGSNQRFGKRVTEQYGTHDAGVQGGLTSMTGILAGSVVAWSTHTTFGTQPTGLTIDTPGWTELAREASSNLSVVAAVRDGTAAGDTSIAFSDPVTWFNPHAYMYEVTPAGTPIEVAEVVITASETYRMDRPGNEPASVSFNCQGGQMLLAVLMRSNHAGDTVTDKIVGHTTYGGVELHFLPQFHERDYERAAQFSTAILMSPPNGPQTFTTAGFTGNIGYVNLLLIAFSGGSGVVGVRHVSSQGGNALACNLPDSQPGSLMVAVQCASHTYNEMTGSYGWELIEYVNEPGTNGEDPPTQLASWVFAGVGGPGFSLVLTPAAYSSTLTLVMEMVPDLDVNPAQQGTGQVIETPLIQQGVAVYEDAPTPNGQEFHTYFEIWHDYPQVVDAMLQPDTYTLSSLPGYLGAVVIFCAKVKATYASMNDNIADTMGMEFRGNGHQMKAVLNLLKARNPNMKLYLGIQQYNFDFRINEPYHPGGWGGLNTADLTAHERFCQDMGCVGIVIDYEVLYHGPINDLAYHCYTINGKRYCYTDEEQVKVVKMFRAHFPRPFELGINFNHVGAYGEDEFTFSAPGLGWNTGMSLCCAKDPAASAALDFTHLMTYDAGGGYDPRVAVRAYQKYFPNLRHFMGIRVGPADFAGAKITGYEFRDYANTCIKLGLAGGHMYASQWDFAGAKFALPDGDPPPYGDYNHIFPDGNVAGGIFARAFQVPYRGRPRMNNMKIGGNGVITPT